MLRLAPWFHPIAMRDEALVQSCTDNWDNLPRALPAVVTLSCDWRSCVELLAHHVHYWRLESPEEAHDGLVQIAYLQEHRAPFDVFLADGLPFDVLFYCTRG